MNTDIGGSNADVIFQRGLPRKMAPLTVASGSDSLDRDLPRNVVASLLSALQTARDPSGIAAAFDAFTMEERLRWGRAKVDEAHGNEPLTPFSDIELRIPSKLGPRILATHFSRIGGRVRSHIVSASLSVVWDVSDANKGQAGEFYPAIAAFAASKHVQLVLSYFDGRRYLVRFKTGDRLRLSNVRVLPLIAQVQILAMHASEALRAVTTARDALPPLSEAQIDLFQSILNGHTAADISSQLAISCREVEKRAFAAASQLGCNGRHQAAALALHQGLLGSWVE